MTAAEHAALTAPELRLALAKIADLLTRDHDEWDENDSDLLCAQKRGGTLDRIGDVILDLDDTIFDDLDPKGA